jgi:acetyl-CoA C-acetyltransferase
MAEPVIVATARSPIGRAFKGSLVDVRPDDLTAEIVKAALAKVPQLEGQPIDDLMLGCGLPGGEQGFNMARVVAILAGLDEVPGCTITRYCSSSLQTIRMAAHAIKAGEGDTFIAAGVETVSRFAKGSSDGLPDTMNPRSPRRASARSSAPRAAQGPWEPPSRAARHLHRDGPDRGERRRDRQGVTREEMDEFAALSQQRAEASRRRTGSSTARSPRSHPRRDRGRQGRRPPPRHHRGEAGRPQPGVPPRRADHRRQRLPPQRRRGGGRRHERQRAKQLGITPLARIVSSGVSALNPEIMGLGPVEAAARR